MAKKAPGLQEQAQNYLQFMQSFGPQLAQIQAQTGKAITEADLQTRMEYMPQLMGAQLSAYNQYAPDLAATMYRLYQQYAPRYSALQTQLALDREGKMAPELANLSMDTMRRIDPQSLEGRQRLYDVLLADLERGYNLSPEYQREVTQDIRAAQAARGNILGPAAITAEATKTGAAREALYQQRLGNFGNFLSQPSAATQFYFNTRALAQPQGVDYGLIPGFDMASTSSWANGMNFSPYAAAGNIFQSAPGNLNAMYASTQPGAMGQMWNAQFPTAMGGGGSGGGGSPWASAAGGALSGAASGAMIGSRSIVPGIGTAVGAVAGGLIGGAGGYASGM